VTKFDKRRYINWYTCRCMLRPWQHSVRNPLSQGVNLGKCRFRHQHQQHFQQPMLPTESLQRQQGPECLVGMYAKHVGFGIESEQQVRQRR
jgi:hypothetical protein